MNSKVNFPFHLRFQSWHVQIIYVGEINAKIIEKDLVNTLKIWVHFQFLLYATIVLKINDLGYSSFFSPMYMDIVWCKIRVFFMWACTSMAWARSSSFAFWRTLFSANSKTILTYTRGTFLSWWENETNVFLREH